MDELNVEHRLSMLEQDTKSVHRRLNNLEKLVECVHTIATETKAMREDLNATSERVDEIERRPMKRYETVVTSIITGLITTTIGILIGLLF